MRRNSKKRDTEKRGKGRFNRKSRGLVLRKKKCRFCTEKGLKISHTDYQLLRRFTTERGKIVPSRISGCCARHQRKLTNAVKRARNIGILPFLAE